MYLDRFSTVLCLSIYLQIVFVYYDIIHIKVGINASAWKSEAMFFFSFSKSESLSKPFRLRLYARGVMPLSLLPLLSGKELSQ